MRKIAVNGRVFEIAVAVFDKDGLLFDSRAFWCGLAQARLDAALRYLAEETVLEWLAVMDVRAGKDADGKLRVEEVKPDGVTAVASPDEEVMITAAFLLQRLYHDWPKSRETAREIFAEGDRRLDLEKAIAPRAGFPGIFRRLREAGIPYGIATSDDLQRAEKSVGMYDDFEKLDFVITPRDVKRNKPAPDMLELVAKRYAVEGRQILMVGDSYVDMMMADAAGAVGIGIPEFTHMERRMRPYAAALAKTLDDIVILKE
ncbi:MAG: HAD family hydrolase [Lachnospiraceae bacterium]